MKKIFLMIIMAATVVACQNQSVVKAYLDNNGDCIFENDIISYRINGASNPVVTSGMQAIFKAVVDKQDLVKDLKAGVSASLNDGGSAIVVDDSLYFPQENFSSFEIVEQTKGHVTFTLTYPEWQMGEDSISLERTITIREHSHYCEVSDIYTNNGESGRLVVAAGFVKHAVESFETGVDYMITWEDMPGSDEFFGLGIVMPMSDSLVFNGPCNSAVAYYPTKYGRKVDYAIGSCWDKAGFATFDSWAEKVRL